MEQTPIAVRTLGELVQYGYGLNAYCPSCNHRRDLNLDDLIARLGADFVVVGTSLGTKLKCTKCGDRNTTVQLHLSA